MAPTPTIDLPGSCPVEYQPSVAQRLLILKCLERLMVEGRRHSLPRYGTDHDSEPRFQGFVYQRAHFSANKKSIEVTVRPRKGSVAVCSR